MNSKNSKTNEPHKFKLDLTDKLNPKNPDLKFQHQLGMILLICLMVLILLQIADIQEYFEFIIKKHETLTETLSVQIYPNKMENRIVFKIKTGYKSELLTPETMKLLVSRKKDVDKGKYGEKVPKLESVEVVLVHCNLVKNDYQHTSKVLFTFVPNKQFGQLINNYINTVNTEFSFVEAWFTDQASKALESEDNVNLTLINGQTL